jgi:hypothetical protein
MFRFFRALASQAAGGPLDCRNGTAVSAVPPKAEVKLAPSRLQSEASKRKAREPYHFDFR